MSDVTVDDGLSPTRLKTQEEGLPSRRVGRPVQKGQTRGRGVDGSTG